MMRAILLEDICRQRDAEVVRADRVDLAFLQVRFDPAALPVLQRSVTFMPKPEAATTARNLASAFEHYNQKHPHGAEISRTSRIPAFDGFSNPGVMMCPEL
jgi:hypothetical protein